jgi:eukaryotic-like serine/threonine-protein kinase
MAGTGAVEPLLNDPSARVGATVDKYTLIRVLGRGGMGAVYEARHGTLSRRFAIKFLLPELATNREILRRFENEAKAAGGLEHPNLAAVTDFGRADDGAPYIVMEFLEGEDCAKLLRREGRIAVGRAANIVAQACRGLAIAHRSGIVHRDLKPENLFVTDAGDGSDLVKVLDFGIAKLRIADASVITGTGASFGTAFYMSPEQARGAGDVDPRTDVWSLGVVLYEFLAGRKPFVGEQFLEVIHQILSFEPPPLATLRPDLPAKLVAAIERAMRKDAAERLLSVKVLGEALAPFVSSRPEVEPPVPEQALGATLATPATRSGELSLGERAEIVNSRANESLVEPPGSGFLKKALLLTAIVVVAAVALLVARRRSPEPAAVAEPTAAAPPSQPPAPSMPTSAAPPPLPAIPAPPKAATVPPSPAASSPAGPSPAASGVVRTLSEHSKRSSNRRAAHRPPDVRPTAPQAAPPDNPPNPAPTPDKPPVSHGIRIDREDPFGP